MYRIREARTAFIGERGKGPGGLNLLKNIKYSIICINKRRIIGKSFVRVGTQPDVLYVI